MPSVNGILESLLVVEDMERSARFYQKLFGFERLAEDPDRLLALSVAGRQVLLLTKKGSPKPMVGGALPPRQEGSLHVAFSIATEELEGWAKWLEESGVRIALRKPWERGGQSLYFNDPDRHLIELATPGTWTIY